MVTRYAQGQGKADEWEISLFASQLVRTINIPAETVSEESEEVRNEGVSEESEEDA
jgi:hypothetical protein